MPVEIDQNVCGKCLACATVCPEEIFSVIEDKLEIAEGCTDCGICIESCPVEAIKQV
ncbi:MAG: 4Fe-4S binding protein [Candidatus Heimdallarchaeota archaeon]|nr:4Fe-4S binding protein [Candidatus Heimdallarchaeota archaeon]